MKDISYYKLILSEHSLCPKCNNPIFLLTDPERKDSPSFFICFNCRFVGHVGIGKVLESR